MPELPEVETIRLGLDQLIRGQMIKSVETTWAKSLQITSAQLQQFVLGQKIKGIARRAKVLFLELENGYNLMVHLKMTGQLVFQPRRGERFAGGHPTDSMMRELPDRSTRVIFEFASGDRLFFNDQRKFGWVKLVHAEEVPADALISRLGPEPLTADFTLEGFLQQIKRHPKAPIKAVILDQSTVSGIGNIYADESLHLAKVHPARLAGSLTKKEIEALHGSIREVLRQAIDYGGTSFTNFVNILGVRGNYLQNARVFRREGQACPVCGTPIEKIRVAGRGTHFCPHCQKH